MAAHTLHSGQASMKVLSLLLRKHPCVSDVSRLAIASMKVLSLLLRNNAVQQDEAAREGLNESPELIAQEFP